MVGRRGMNKQAIPGFWGLLWMLFMQPIRLHKLLQELGIDPGASALKMWRTPGPLQTIQRVFIIRVSYILIIMIIPLFTL